MADWQSKRRSTLENLLMSFGRMHTTNQRTMLERIQRMNDLLCSFIMNQATPHLEAWSCLINNESSNHCGQSKMSIALKFKRKASTRTS